MVTIARFRSMFVWQTFNALFIIRVVSKFFVERLKEDDVYRQFCAVAASEVSSSGDSKNSVQNTYVEPGNRLQKLVDALVDVLVDIPNRQDYLQYDMIRYIILHCLVT